MVTPASKMPRKFGWLREMTPLSYYSAEQLIALLADPEMAGISGHNSMYEAAAGVRWKF